MNAPEVMPLMKGLVAQTKRTRNGMLGIVQATEHLNNLRKLGQETDWI